MGIGASEPKGLAGIAPRLLSERRSRAALAPQTAEAAPEAEPVRFDPRPPSDGEAFDRLVRALLELPMDELDLPARNLAAAPAEVWPQLRDRLLAARERPKREYRDVLGVIGGDVPNRYGHFALHWKRDHGYDVRLSDDWFEDLLALSPGRISSLLRPVYRDALLTAALLRASPGIAAAQPELLPEVVAVLLDVAYLHGGTFRDEVGRAIDALGDPAIPHLLRESIAPPDADAGSVPERRAAYALHCLDRRDRLHPSRAIEAVAGDRRLLAEVLRAYGQVRDPEAAELLLARVDADAPGVREAAREAFGAYVTGPLPRVRRKSVRLLGGRTTTRKAQLSYRESARLAIRERLASEAPERLEEACALFRSGGLVDRECERQPERLFTAYLAHLDGRRLARRDVRVAEALAHPEPEAGAAMLDTLLTDGTELADPGLIAPFYVEVAAAAEARGEPARAAQLLRKSAVLLAEADPQRSRELSVDALVLEAEMPGVDPGGAAMLLYTAAELAPKSTAVHAALARLEAERRVVDGTLLRRLTGGLVGLVLALALLGWLAARLHRRGPATP